VPLWISSANVPFFIVIPSFEIQGATLPGVVFSTNIFS
jgi:hypothetical protein